MKRGIIIVLLSLSLLSCQGKDKEITQTEQIATQEQEPKKLHWWELPQ
ncbi:hypothetical protein H4K33_16365, partial [Myroides sp. WP-1]|nr:hypothetical protein [Myroides sp. WP-1]